MSFRDQHFSRSSEFPTAAARLSGGMPRNVVMRSRGAVWFTRMVRIAFFSLLLYAAASFALAWFLTGAWRITASPFIAHAAWTRQQVVTEDGVDLTVWSLGHGDRPLVVLAHDHHASAYQMADLARFLQTEGFDVMAFDFRAHGVSGGDRSSMDLQEARDVEAVLGYVKQDRGGLGRVAWVGRSMGAAALTYAPTARELGGIVLVDCYDSVHAHLNRKLHSVAPIDLRPIGDLMLRFAQWRLGFPLEQVRPIEQLPNLRNTVMLLVYSGMEDLPGADLPQRMLEAAGNRAELVYVPDRQVEEAGLVRDPAFRMPILQFLRDVL